MTEKNEPKEYSFERDVVIEKPGIVGARWWHRSLIDEGEKVQRRQFLVGLAFTGGLVGLCCMGGGVMNAVSSAFDTESTSLATRNSLEMQKGYGWDFGSRGVALVFDGRVETPFVRSQLDELQKTMTPHPAGGHAKYHIGTLVESLFARPTMALPNPGDGQPPPDSAPFKTLAEVLVPVATPAMKNAYAAGEALARLVAPRHKGVAVLVDMPGPEAVAFAAGAAQVFEPVLLLDNWPHPHGVVPSHMALAALAYYQPRFAAHKASAWRPPLFVIDRLRLASYSEESDRFDNRYFARMPSLEALARDGVTALFYVVGSAGALPEPADLHGVLATSRATPLVRAVAVSDFTRDPGISEGLLYGGTRAKDEAFWKDYAPDAPAAPAGNTARDHRFVPHPVPPRPANIGMVPVIVAASGVILSAALDRKGSMNRFAGGWSG